MEKKNQKKREFKLQAEQGVQVLSYFNTAYLDYKASRILLQKDLIAQGSILANTSMEKYFKGVKAMLGHEIPRHHDITVNKISKTIKNSFPQLYNKLNQDFLNLINKSYSLRYMDELDVGFEIVLPKKRILAELDYSVYLFNKYFKITSKNSKVKSSFESDKINKNEILLSENFILNNISKIRYVNDSELCYQFSKTDKYNFVEIIFSPTMPIDYTKFLIEPMKIDFAKYYEEK